MTKGGTDDKEENNGIKLQNLFLTIRKCIEKSCNFNRF